MLSLLQPILSTRMFEEQEEAGNLLTDSEESIYSGLEDSGSDSLTEEEEDQDHGPEEKSKGKLRSRNSQVSWSSQRLVMLCFWRTASKLAGTAMKNWGCGRIPALPTCPSGSLWNLSGFCFHCSLEPTKHAFCYCQTSWSKVFGQNFKNAMACLGFGEKIFFVLCSFVRKTKIALSNVFLLCLTVCNP